MDSKDYYKVMGVSPNANEKEIKLAYRRLARKYHPDVSKESHASEKFKEVGEAYEVLKDSAKRKVYDEYLQEAARPQARQPSYHREQPDYDDFFESLFGVPPGYQAQQSNTDLYGTVEITLEEAFQGAVKDLQIPVMSNPQAPQTVRVKIPAGIKSGQKIRLSGQGDVSPRTKNRGDLYLTVQIKKHPFFDVIGNDIYVTLPVTPWEVALGASVAVPTLAGKVDLKIPAGSQGGQKLRLKHRGIPGQVNGDQYVLLKIITPKPTSDAARALYQKMADEMPMNPRAEMGA